ncbi:MAG TPA: carboxymuconolactone decarboxylase family protein [Afipia sp.]
MTTQPVTALSFDALDEGLRTALAPTVERLGYFGEFFQYVGHAPAALSGFMDYTAAVKSLLPDRLNEMVALSICSALKCSYERIQHERLSDRLGLERGWIAALVGRAPVTGLPTDELAVRALAIAVATRNVDGARSSLAIVAGTYGEPTAIALLLQATRFVSICTIAELFALSLPVSSIFDEPGSQA